MRTLLKETPVTNEIGDAAVSRVPIWTVDVGHGCEVGITLDDGCFVVLTRNWVDQWMPSTHIPKPVALRLGELATSS